MEEGREVPNKFLSGQLIDCLAVQTCQMIASSCIDLKEMRWHRHALMRGVERRECDACKAEGGAASGLASTPRLQH